MIYISPEKIEDALSAFSTNCSEDEILLIMRNVDYFWLVCESGVKFLKLEKKTEEEILSIMEKIEYKSYTVCEAGIKLLKSEDKILLVLRKTNYQKYVCKSGIKVLKLEEKSDNQILALMKETGYNGMICKVGIPLIKSEDTISSLIKEISEHDDHVCIPLIGRWLYERELSKTKVS